MSTKTARVQSVYKDVPFGRGRGYLSLPSELQGDVLERRGLIEVEDDVPAEESRVHVLAGALEGEHVRVDKDVEGRLVLVLHGHVVVMGRGIGV